jgi:hypothetical protein
MLPPARGRSRTRGRRGSLAARLPHPVERLGLVAGVVLCDADGGGDFGDGAGLFDGGGFADAASDGAGLGDAVEFGGGHATIRAP